jgi:hypothetical protein
MMLDTGAKCCLCRLFAETFFDGIVERSTAIPCSWVGVQPMKDTSRKTKSKVA